MRHVISTIILLSFVASVARAASPLDEYFKAETALISQKCLMEIKTLEDWNAKKVEYRRQLAEMLGLWPMPERTDLQATVTGKLDHPEFTVEKLHFQSRPHLYVTANLYVPKNLQGKAPAVLYVSGHGTIKKNGYNYGAKAYFQDWGAWFARNGYVCLVLDTLQLGEIEGIHHGTYREKMWWWHSRGYTPAGVEAWNGMRALDYLESRPEVDKERMGITGRSGGGAYSWWVSALDDRIKCSVPVAGITDMHNHIVDGTIEGHCDCMFMVNTYRWDFAQVAALIAPRPLLISNTDKDTIFPLDGVERLHAKTAAIYKLHKADDKLGLLITEGGHNDNQELQVPAMRWFNRWLKNEKGKVETLPKAFFEVEQLRVFDKLPEDQINTKIHETFVPMAPPPVVPKDKEEWAKMKQGWMERLKKETFAGWPKESPPLVVTLAFTQKSNKEDFELRAYQYTTQIGKLAYFHAMIPLKPAAKGNMKVIVTLQEEKEVVIDKTIRQQDDTINVICLIRRDVLGEPSNERKDTQIRRRFALLGQTVDGVHVWEVGRALQALKEVDEFKGMPISIAGNGHSAAIAVYAALHEPAVNELLLENTPETHRDGPQLINIFKFMDMPVAVAMAAERCKITIRQKQPGGWEYPIEVGKKLGWAANQVQVKVETAK